MALGKSKRNQRIADRQLQLRGKLWPEINSNQIWSRKERQGFTTIPRALPLVLAILDKMAIGKPVSSTYFELWCRAFDEGFVTLNRDEEMAFHAGFSGQRSRRTWLGRLKRLEELGFISVKPGAFGPQSYALLLNPYLVIREHYDKGEVPDEYFLAMVARLNEIRADDLDETVPGPENP